MKTRTRFILGCILTVLLWSDMSASSAMAEPVPVVSAKATVTTLTRNQIIDIFLGKTARFPDGQPATPVDQPEGMATRNDFYATYAGKSPAQIKAYWSKIIFTGRGSPPKEISGPDGVKKFVAATPGAISYIDRSALDASVKEIKVVP